MPLNNVFHTLLGLEFAGQARRFPDVRDRPPKPGGPYVDVARYFQRHRWAAADSVAILERFADAVRDGRRVFLSYKRSDFAHDPTWPGRLGEELSRRDVSCWWDRWYLPQGGEPGQANLDEDLLADLLTDAVRQSVWLAAVVGSHLRGADDDSWPRREWHRAGVEGSRMGRRHAMHRVAVFLSDSVADADITRWSEPGDRLVLAGTHPSPAEVAEAISGVIASH